ncbi:hypothetical protein B0J12DRAFT_639260 [Macrophomina phaseolina]|nr:hypothetical protein B0J12DRAFT_639260 [Macrophomina phaseolina]
MTHSRAAQRVVLPLNATFFSFLYQTPTILGRTPRRSPARIQTRIRCLNVASEVATRRVPHRNRKSSEESSSNDVPFEGEQLEAEAFHRQRKSTITANERQTFEKLFKQYTSKQESPETGLNNISDDLSDSPEDTLDSILDSAIAEVEPETAVHDTSSGLTSRARRKLMERQAIVNEEEDTPLRIAQREQFERVENMMKEAKSDVELWNILETEVLSAVRRMDLDASRSSSGKGQEAQQLVDGQAMEGDQPFSEFQVIGPNYPSFLLIAMRQLRVDFPGSTLGLALLPAIKSLGRGSFALGASTELYNELLAMTWLTYSDFQGLDDLLQEMENGGIDFDTNTLDILDSIKKNALDVRSGRLGEGASAVLDMDRFQRGLRRLQRWRDAIRLRMEAEAIRQAKEYEVQL